MLSLVLLYLCGFAVSGKGSTLNNPIDIYALIGSNITLKSTYNPQLLDSLSWIKEENINEVPGKNLEPFFIGQKLCEVTNDSNTVFQYPYLQFDCANVCLFLYDIQPTYAGIYNSKAFADRLEYNSYFKLHVIDIPPPKCEITSRFLDIQASGDDYCLIEINCTNSKYPAKVMYNGRQSTWRHYVSERGGNKNLPNFYETYITVNGTHKSFHFDYPFSDLCQTTQSLEYNYNDLDLFLILIIVTSVIVLVGCLVLLYCRCKKQKTDKSVHIPLQH